MNQRTLGKEVRLSGKALQTGKEVHLTCRPADEGTGTVFIRTDLPGRPAVHARVPALSENYLRRSTLISGAAEVQTVEHFLAALWGAGIDNAEVLIDGAEVPAMGGSAMGFLDAFKSAGTVEQSSPRREIRITGEERLELGGGSITILPSDTFSISYRIDYPVPSIGEEEFSMDMDPAVFEKEIAPARTFCMWYEALFLRMRGLGRGADRENTLIMGRRRPVGSKMRFRDEPVRHKVLDLIGDLYVLGRPVVGKIRAEKSGHRLNAELARKIYDKYIKAEERT